MSEDWKTRMKRYEEELLQMRGSSRLISQPPPDAKPPSRTALLRLTVQTADGIPLQGAIVSVDKRTPRGREALYVRLTDEYGQIEPLPLPVGAADTVFDIGAAANGFYREHHSGIAVLGDLPPYTLSLSPLPEL